MKAIWRRVAIGSLGLASAATMAAAVAGAASANAAPAVVHHARAAHHARDLAHHARAMAPAALSWPVVRIGARGERVWAIQYLLKDRGYRLTADGVFGRRTKLDVARFQKVRKLTPDGVVGPATWTRLVRLVKFGSRGDAVRALQHNLRGYGYRTVTVTGFFGTATRAAVRNFQFKNKLKVDGIVGVKTWNAIIRHEK
jgi:peptidoglycan hydrolase-like protein with peptidoglycan-binding domain